MKRTARWLQVLPVVLLLAAAVAPVFASKSSGFQTGFTQWKGSDGDFGSWVLDGTALQDGAGALVLDPASAAQGTDPYPASGYNGGNYYNGAGFLVGEATSPEMLVSFPFTEAIASWNAATPGGTWIETQFRAQYGTRWSKWYTLGIWASDDTTIRRHSVQSQGDADGYVAVDTFVSSNKKETTQKFQLKIRLFSTDGTTLPTVRNASVAYSTSAPKSSTVSSGNSQLWNTMLNVPPCSQMVYPDGGEVWCSPTSTSMVLGYWGYMPGPCEPRVREAVAGTDDWIYKGHGNWPFNTAYAASREMNPPMQGYVARFTGLDKLEPWIAAGVPVVMSVAWKKGELTNAPVSSSSGHLIVLVGFDAAGNALVNDPAAASDPEVPRMYLRSELESIWLTASGGTVYLIFPEGLTVPGF